MDPVFLYRWKSESCVKRKHFICEMPLRNIGAKPTDIYPRRRKGGKRRRKERPKKNMESNSILWSGCERPENSDKINNILRSKQSVLVSEWTEQTNNKHNFLEMSLIRNVQSCCHCVTLSLNKIVKIVNNIYIRLL